MGIAEGRDIGVVIGLVMASRELDRDAAFAVLQSISHETNRQRTDIAALVLAIAESGVSSTSLRSVDPLQGAPQGSGPSTRR